MKRSTWLFAGLGILGLLGITWFFTGGIALERLQRFEQVDRPGPVGEEVLAFWIGGHASTTDIPFLFQRYSEGGPYKLTLKKSSQESAWRELRLHSVRISWPGDAGIDLVQEKNPLVLPVMAGRSSNTSSDGIVESKWYSASQTFEQELPIPFSEGLTVTCIVDLELIGDVGTKRLHVVAKFVGHQSSRILTYWESIASC